MIHPCTREARALLAGIVAALSIPLVATLVLPATAAAARNTTVTLRYFDNPDGRDFFHGELLSSKKRCVVDRTIKLFRNSLVADVRVGRDRHPSFVDSSPFRSLWAIGKEDPPDGRYYARVKRKPRKHGKPGCEGDTSNTITVEDDPQT